MRPVIARPIALIASLACYLCPPPTCAQPLASTVKQAPLREAYFGDLHLHTSYSLDAYLMGTTTINPDQAYRFAKGKVVNYLGQPVQRREPLDFLAVTDHSENIGVLSELNAPNSEVSKSGLGERLRAMLVPVTDSDGRLDFAKDPGWPEKLGAFWRDYFGGTKSHLPNDVKAEPIAAWTRTINYANSNYEPGKFTTFIAYEWTAAPYGANLHRNVIFEGSSAPFPFTAQDSREPQDLWAWLKAIRKNGIEALAIPHNGNASNGLMYDWIGGGEYMNRAYAEERQLNEPLSEVSQGKGQSETHPLLSPNDEFANYEIFDFMEERRQQVGRLSGSYLRDALGAGMVMQRKIGANPFKYGFVGGSDLHTGLSVSAQADYAGSPFTANLGGGKPTEQKAASGLAGGAAAKKVNITLETTSGNLTGVWAESNTRESIYSALRRRETFATTGTRLRFRFFGGWQFPENLLQQPNWLATAYAAGVPMGCDLPAKTADANSPSFAIWASKDPNSGNLDRVQVIKVWEESGRQKEKVFDVVWAGSRKRDPLKGTIPPVGDTVDPATGRYSNNIGAAELMTIWKDPEFNPQHLAAYYLRVLEIPTPRWSTLLAIQNGLPVPKAVPASEQQRGWSSPIWYTPQG